MSANSHLEGSRLEHLEGSKLEHLEGSRLEHLEGSRFQKVLEQFKRKRTMISNCRVSHEPHSLYLHTISEPLFFLHSLYNTQFSVDRVLTLVSVRGVSLSRQIYLASWLRANLTCYKMLLKFHAFQSCKL